MCETAGSADLGQLLGIVAALLLLGGTAEAAPQKIIIDSDIGDDIDDAFAVALALNSPEFQVLGLMSDFGDTPARARMLDRIVLETGHGGIPVAVGIASTANLAGFSQRRYAEGGPVARTDHPQAVDFLLEQIRRHPGEITLVAIGPSPNLGAAIDKDPVTFRKLKSIVMMGGSFAPVSDGFGPATPPHPEWNIKNDIPAAQKIFTAGVPLFVMPLDSTVNLKLDEIGRNLLFAHGTPMTDILAVTYHQWVYGTHGQVTPTLFDPMTLAFLLQPSLCPVTPMHVRVDDAGLTRVEPGAPNAQVCLKSDPDAFQHFILTRLMQ
jgi:purine nucleosidase